MANNEKRRESQSQCLERTRESELEGGEKGEERNLKNIRKNKAVGIAIPVES